MRPPRCTKRHRVRWARPLGSLPPFQASTPVHGSAYCVRVLPLAAGPSIGAAVRVLALRSGIAAIAIFCPRPSGKGAPAHLPFAVRADVGTRSHVLGRPEVRVRRVRVACPRTARPVSCRSRAGAARRYAARKAQASPCARVSLTKPAEIDSTHTNARMPAPNQARAWCLAARGRRAARRPSKQNTNPGSPACAQTSTRGYGCAQGCPKRRVGSPR